MDIKIFVKNVYRESHRTEINKYMKVYSKDNYDKIKIKCDKWRNERIRNYKKKNRHRYIKYNKSYTHIWRMFVHTTLKRIGGKKEAKTIEYLKYSPLEFKERLEMTFTEGMCWENYGKWHIDHIKPLSKFEEGTPIHIVNSLDNIQALWAIDNLLKGDK